jgi:hypothetical protein
MKMSSHSELADERGGMPSASSVEGLFLCRGKFLAEKDMPDIEWSESKEGTIRHVLAEMDMPEDHIGDSERAYAVSRSKHSLNQIRTEIMGHLVDMTKGFVIREQRMWLKGTNGVPFLSGKPDYVEIWPESKTALVADYKMLYGEHTIASKNPQLFTLASLVAQAHKDIDRIYVAIINPMLSIPYSLSLLSRELISKWEQKLQGLVTEINKPTAPRVAGVKQCKYCRALVFCPQARKLMKDNMHEDIEKNMNPEALSKAYALVPLYEKFAASVKKTVRANLKNDPNSVDGYRLGSGGSLAKYDSQKVLKELRLRDFSPEDIDRLVSVQERNLIRVWADKTGESAKDAKESLRAAMAAADAIEMKRSAQRILKEKKEDQ